MRDLVDFYAFWWIILGVAGKASAASIKRNMPPTFAVLVNLVSLSLEDGMELLRYEILIERPHQIHPNLGRHKDGRRRMLRTSKKHFVQFVMICILFSWWGATIPRYTPNTPVNNLSPQHPIISQAFLQNFLSFERPLPHSRMAHWDYHILRDRQSSDQRFSPFTSSTTDLSQTRTWYTRTPATAYRNPVIPPYPLTLHRPIIIESDAEFASQGWPGNGTQENPYTISNLNITATLGESCILIENTRVHFVITNCWMHDQGTGDGVLLANVTNGLIANTTWINLYFGITLRSSESIEIFNNTLIGSWRGIEVVDATTTKIVNNTCSNSFLGIGAFNSSSTEIVNNTLKDCEFFGCEIYPVNDNIIANNSLTNCGFFFGVWEDRLSPLPLVGVGSLNNVESQIIGNLVNNRPLIFWQRRSGGTVPLDVGQIILLECNGVTIQDQYITNTSIGIFVGFSTHTQIVNSICSHHTVYGICIHNSTDITVNYNLCRNNFLVGISFYHSRNSVVTNNTCKHNGVGIDLLESNTNQLLNNTCNSNQERSWAGGEGWGHWFGGEGISIFGESNVVKWNHCNDNTGSGIFISGHNNSVLENTCTNNGVGISFRIYPNNIIIGNCLIGCGFDFEMPDGEVEWQDVEISGNTVNGRPLIFWHARVNERVPSGAGQIILFNCRNIIVERQNLTNCPNALLIRNTDHSLFANNLLSDIAGDGISIADSFYNHFTGNIISDCSRGLNLVDASYSYFTNNILSNITQEGICIIGAGSNHFSENILTNCSVGFFVSGSVHCLFRYNILYDNTHEGISFLRSHYNHILGNLLSNNGCNIWFHSDSQNNTVEWNTFIGNQSTNANDDCNYYLRPWANIFDRNFWSDYTGVDANLDGYGDTAYNIAGDASNRDLHPIKSPINLLAIRLTQRILLFLERVTILLFVIVVVILVLARLRRGAPKSSEVSGVNRNSMRR